MISLDSAKAVSGKRILIVDDHADAVRLNTIILRQYGFEVMGAYSAREALDLLDRCGPFDVVVSDISMPEMDGYGLLREIRALEKSDQRAAVPAIALSAFASAHDRHLSLAQGFLAHLTKPIRSRELLHVIAEALAAKPSLESIV